MTTFTTVRPALPYSPLTASTALNVGRVARVTATTGAARDLAGHLAYVSAHLRPSASRDGYRTQVTGETEHLTITVAVHADDLDPVAASVAPCMNWTHHDGCHVVRTDDGATWHADDLTTALTDAAAGSPS